METERIVKIKIKGLSLKQKEILSSIIETPVNEVKYHVIRASRKAGKTHMLIRGASRSAIMNENFEIGFMCAYWKMTESIFRDFIKFLPAQVIKKTMQGERIEFVSGSSIDFYSANSSNIPVNRSFNELYLDEFALYKKDVWGYLKPTVIAKPNAKVIISSTPRGKNEFYKMCMDGIEGRARTKQYRMHWSDNKFINPQDIEDARLTTPLPLFLQEYESEFTDAISGVFGTFKHLLLIDKWIEPEIDKQYFLGLDISGTGEDKTILTIINQNGKTAFIYECEETDFVKQADELEPIIKKYNAKGYGEKTGLGQALIDILNSRGCRMSYWNTTNESKQKLVSGLILNINKNELMLPTVDLCPKLENEMSCYSGKRTSSGLIRYEGDDGVHDDYVMSLMLANEARKTFSDHTTVYNNEDIRFEIENKYTNDMPMYELERLNSNWSDNLKYNY